jgi:hypothetical protein
VPELRPAARTVEPVLLWFVGSVTIIVMVVFRDPRFDYRLLAVGALLPDAVDGTIGNLVGGALVMHSVLSSILVLALVMAATVDKRDVRRRWLALPIGMFLHLVVDGAVDDARVFWWPLAGWSFGDAQLPMVQRGWWNVPLEVLGALALVWIWRRHGLADPQRRTWLRRTGQLIPSHSSAGGAPPVC